MCSCWWHCTDVSCWMSFYNPTSLCSCTAFTVNDETGLKQFPFQLKPVPRLHWEDPTADHLMTHEVCVCVYIVLCVHICKQEDNLSVVRSSNDSLSIAHALLQCIFTHIPVTHWNLLYSLSTDEPLALKSQRHCAVWTVIWAYHSLVAPVKSTGEPESKTCKSAVRFMYVQVYTQGLLGTCFF